MSFAEYFRVAWEALLANKLRSILTMIGIIIGVGSVIAVVAIGQGAQTAILGEFSSFGGDTIQVFAGSRTQTEGQAIHREPITPSDIQVLAAALPQAKAIAPITGLMAPIRAGSHNVTDQVIGLTPDYLNALPFNLRAGRSLTNRDEASANAVMVLTATPAKTLFPDLADPTGQVVYVGGYPFEVVGVMQPSTSLISAIPGANMDNYYLAPFSVIQRLSGKKDVYNVQVILSKQADPKSTGEDAVSLLKKRHPHADYDYFSASQIGESLGRVTGFLTIFVASVAGIALLVGGIGIMNIMLVSVTERTREIGVRKALGARRRDVLWQFIIEAVLICLVGGLVGVLLALVPVGIVGHLMHISIWLNVKAVLLALSFSAGVGLIFGVYPANKAARMDPIEALRYE